MPSFGTRFGVVRLMLHQARRDGVHTPTLVVSLVLVMLLLHDWRPGRPEQPCWDVLSFLSWSRSILVPVRQLEVILGRTSFQRIHRGPFHVRTEWFTSALPRFSLPPTMTARGWVGVVVLVMVPRRFRRRRTR